MWSYKNDAHLILIATTAETKAITNNTDGGDNDDKDNNKNNKSEKG